MKIAHLGRLLGVAAIAVASVAAAPNAFAYSKLFIFGDSLSDSGNNAAATLFEPAQVVTGDTYVPSFTYGPAGTYSNGPVWASGFASALGLAAAPSLLNGTNFAFGGATTSGPGFPYSLTAQVGQFLAGANNVAPADALYVVAGGGNNARAAGGALATPGLSFAQQVGIISSNASNYATDIGTIVDSLQAAGAHNIIVWNTPNLGLSPFAGATGTQGIGALLSATMNNALDYRLATEVGVKTFDIFGLVSVIAANPGAYGVTNTSNACGAPSNNCDPATALFWDGIHPTAKGHQLIASAMLVTAVPEPESFALLSAGLLVVGFAVRRRKAA
jgi:outer membrane lipase/esterase